MKKILSLLLCTAIMLCISSCSRNEANMEQKKIGVLKDANVISTSFNEQMKIQLKTENKFFVVVANGNGFPQLNIGDTLTGKFNGNDLCYIADGRGEWFKVR
jgi:hypothetical protein